MTVYVEYVLFSNFIITYILLNLSNHIVKEKHFIRTLSASIFGALIALVYPIININGMVMFVLKLAVGFLIVFCAYKTKSFKKLLFYYFVFMFLTALYGGINLMLYFCIYGSFTKDKLMPTSLILFIAYSVAIILKQMLLRFYKIRQISSFVYDIELKIKNKSVKVKGYLDSGNVLCDPISCLPIVIINYKTFNKLFSDFPIQNLLTKQIDGLENGHYIPVSSAVKSGEMLVFNVDEIIISQNNQNKLIKKPVLGLAKTNFNLGECDLLLNPQLVI